MTQTEFTPLDPLARALRSWPVVFFLMLLGGLAGFGISRVQPPVFEAHAAITTSMDYVQSGALTDVEQDNAIGIVGDVIQSEEVYSLLIQRLAGSGINISLPQVQEMASADRYNTAWNLRVQSSDPQLARLIVENWAQVAAEVLSESLEHARAAAALHRHQTGLVSCLESSVSVLPVSGGCEQLTLAQIQSELVDVSSLISQHESGSRGLIAALGFTYNVAPPPAAPSRYGTNTLVLSGALIGLLAGLVLNEFGLASILRRKGN